MQEFYGLQYDTVGGVLGVPLQAFYFNGRFAHRPVTFGRGRVWIDVTGGAPLDCHWLDVEKEDATPDRVPTWNAERHHGTGQWGGAYCDRSTLPKVLEANGTLPLDLWLATLDGTVPDAADLGLPPNVHLVAVQAFGAETAGFRADASVVVDAHYWDAYHA